MEAHKKRLEKAKKSKKHEDWIEYKQNCNDIANLLNEDKEKNIEKTT